MSKTSVEGRFCCCNINLEFATDQSSTLEPVLTPTHVADGLPQPLRNARKLGVNFFETLLPGEHKMGLKKKFHRRKFF